MSWLRNGPAESVGMPTVDYPDFSVYAYRSADAFDVASDVIVRVEHLSDARSRCSDPPEHTVKVSVWQITKADDVREHMKARTVEAIERVWSRWMAL